MSICNQKKLCQRVIAVLIVGIILVFSTNPYKVSAYEGKGEVSPNGYITGTVPAGQSRVIPVGRVWSNIYGQPTTGVTFTANFSGIPQDGLVVQITVRGNGKEKTVTGSGGYLTVAMSDNKAFNDAHVYYRYGYLY